MSVTATQAVSTTAFPTTIETAVSTINSITPNAPLHFLNLPSKFPFSQIQDFLEKYESGMDDHSIITFFEITGDLSELSHPSPVFLEEFSCLSRLHRAILWARLVDHAATILFNHKDDNK